MAEEDFKLSGEPIKYIKEIESELEPEELFDDESKQREFDFPE